jgi:hypothetical protein
MPAKSHSGRAATIGVNRIDQTERAGQIRGLWDVQAEVFSASAVDVTMSVAITEKATTGTDQAPVQG